MALKDTIATLKGLLDTLAKDISKATNGNKAASQRVRTSTIKFEKVAKQYRKESVAAEKKAPKKTKKAAAKKKPAEKKPAVKKAAVKKAATKVKAKPKKKVAKRRATAKVVRKKKRR